MAEFKAYVDIEVGEFVENCSSREIEELVDILIEEGHLDGQPVHI
jgi:hypothetical protein